MNTESRLVHWLVWSLLGLVVISVTSVLVTTLLHQKARLLPIYGQVPDFSLTNQFNKAASLADLRGHVWVADIIFTRCPGPCRQMTRKMKVLQDSLSPSSGVQLVSLTADPSFDTPSILKEYATLFNADSSRWHFLTGSRQGVYGLAINGLKLAVQENTDGKPDDDQFVHSTRFVLVDQQGRIRALSFEGTEAQTVPEILRAVNKLLAER